MPPATPAQMVRQHSMLMGVGGHQAHEQAGEEAVTGGAAAVAREGAATTGAAANGGAADAAAIDDAHVSLGEHVITADASGCGVPSLREGGGAREGSGVDAHPVQRLHAHATIVAAAGGRDTPGVSEGETVQHDSYADTDGDDESYVPSEPGSAPRSPRGVMSSDDGDRAAPISPPRGDVSPGHSGSDSDVRTVRETREGDEVAELHRLGDLLDSPQMYARCENAAFLCSVRT